MTAAEKIRNEFLGAVKRGDVASLVGLYQPDAVLEAPEGRFEGREQIEEYFRAQLLPFDAELNLVATHDAGDTAVTEWVMTAIHTAPLELPDGGKVAPTGKRIQQRGVDVAILSEGRFARHRVYYDQWEALVQLDVVPRGGE